jgi:hypothetical protein
VSDATLERLDPKPSRVRRAGEAAGAKTSVKAAERTAKTMAKVAARAGKVAGNIAAGARGVAPEADIAGS